MAELNVKRVNLRKCRAEKAVQVAKAAAKLVAPPKPSSTGSPVAPPVDTFWTSLDKDDKEVCDMLQGMSALTQPGGGGGWLSHK